MGRGAGASVLMRGSRADSGSRAAKEGGLVLPRAVPRGATIGICAPASPVDEPPLREGTAWLEREGYRVRCAPNLRARCGYLAGTDADRLSDLASMVRAPDVDAILLARGGYGIGRILRELL